MKNRPNILFICTDQHRLSALGCYGPTPCRTPNIDRLARQGVRFERNYTSCPVCSPARASIMTGMHVHTHGMVTNVHELGCNVNELPDSPGLLSRRLEAGGYRCGYTGKWHLGTDFQYARQGSRCFEIPNQPALPTTRGFDGQAFPGHGDGGFGFAEYREYLDDHGWEHVLKTGPEPLTKIARYGILDGPVESTVPYFLANHTIDMLDRFSEDDEPFFIWHNNWGPHEPYYVPREYYDFYKNVRIPQWPNFEWDSRGVSGPHLMKVYPYTEHLEWADWEECIRHYYAFATLIDDQIGRILNHLDSLGIAENTVVIFSSDHGESLGSHGGMTDKGWTHFEETQHTGLIIRDPRPDGCVASGAGRARNELTSLLDLYPTILDFAGLVGEREETHGRSLLPLIRGEQTTWRDSVFVQFYGVGACPVHMITCLHGDFKYGYNTGGGDVLYDLGSDPHEMNNLIDNPDYRKIAYDMLRRIHTFSSESQCQSGVLGSRLIWHPLSPDRKGRAPVPADSYLIDMEW